MSKKKKAEELTDDEVLSDLFSKRGQREVDRQIVEKRDRAKKPVKGDKSTDSK